VFTRSGPARAVLSLAALLTVSGLATSCGKAPDVAGPASAASETTSPATPAAGAATSETVTSETVTPETVTSETVTRIADRVTAAARAEPYSARITVRSLIGGRAALVMKGRVNLNAGSADEMTGRMTVRTAAGATGGPALAVQEVMVGDTIFVRELKTATAPAGPWQRVPASDAGGSPLTDLSGYAKLLLRGGPSVVKGQEQQAGVTATRLSGQIVTEQIKTVEPNLYNRLRAASVASFECDIWIDGAGRTIRLEQWITMQGQEAHNIMTLSTFRRPVTVRAPVD
jgi:hypothetical protein